MKNSNRSNLPYLQGGPPGALKLYIGVEAVVSVILCCASVIGSVYMLIHGMWATILAVPLTIYSTMLAVKAYSGVKKLWNNDGEGATLLESACSGRRTLIWIAYAFSVLSVLVSAVTSRGSGAGFLGSLIGAGISLLIIFPLVNYYKDIEQILGYYVNYETTTGTPVNSSGQTGHLTALCVTFAVLLLAASVIPYFVRTYYNYSSLICLLLYLIAARYLLVNICYRGFLRSHSSAAHDENPTFAPSGYSDTSTLSVLGSIFFGAEALLSLASVIRLASIGRSIPAQTYLQTLVPLVCCILFALTLTRRAGHTLLTITGATVIAVQLIVMLLLNKTSGFLSLLTACLFIIFWIMVIIAAIIRQKGNTVPCAFRIIMIILAALYTASSIVAIISSIKNLGTIYTVIGLQRVLTDSIYFVALLALVQEVAKPDASETAEAEQETLPYPQDSAAE